MSNYNTCEKSHQDIDGFFDKVAKAGAALRVITVLSSPEPTLPAGLVTPPDTLWGLEPFPGLVESQSPNGKQSQAAQDCVKAIIAGECTQFQLLAEDSLTTINSQVKPVLGEI